MTLPTLQQRIEELGRMSRKTKHHTEAMAIINELEAKLKVAERGLLKINHLDSGVHDLEYACNIAGKALSTIRQTGEGK